MNRFHPMFATGRAGANCFGIILLTLAFVFTAAPAHALESGPESMQKLFFMAGSWTCTVDAGKANRLIQTVQYDFAPDGLWMTELSQDSNASRDDWAIQLWGYDTTARRLVAYNFARNGVRTKSVDGWKDGVFVSRRDDDGTIVSLKPLSHDSIQWIIEPGDHSSVVTEECVRRIP